MKKYLSCPWLVAGSFTFVQLLIACEPPPNAVPPDPDLDPRGAIEAIRESAHVTLPGLVSTVFVVRTAGDVPHIYGESEPDVMLVQGFVLARDRFFQMDLLRRYGAGTIASLIGSSGLSLDVSSRSRGLHTLGRRICAQTTETERRALEAFSEGINAYITQVAAGVLPGPSEYISTRPILRPSATNVSQLMEPFTLDDMCALAGAISFSMGFEDEDLLLTRAEDEVIANTHPADVLRRVGAIGDVLNRLDSANGYATHGGNTDPDNLMADARHGRYIRHRRPVEFGAVENGNVAAQALASIGNTPNLRSHQEEMGSNMWAARHPEGGSIIAGDWHLPLTVPSLVFQIGMDTRTLSPNNSGLYQGGFVFPGLPWTAVGTNGDVAWVNTYPELDVTDWYREEIILDAEGRVIATRFTGGERDIRRTAENYSIATIAALESDGGVAQWDTFETFDGRRIVWIEGRPLADGEVQSVSTVNVDGTPVNPADMDDNGVISAVSFDFASFDASNLYGTLRNISLSADVASLGQALDGNVGYTQNVIAADKNGGLFYSNFAGIPCRQQLRDTNGFAAGANPSRLIDGTRYLGFSVGVQSSDQTAGERCQLGRSLFPESGGENDYLVNANNDPIGWSFDGRLDNDVTYIGGPWAPGYRARRIDDEVRRAMGDGSLTIDRMRAIQLDQRSNVAIDILPRLFESLSRSESLYQRTINGEGLTADESRLALLYSEHRERVATWRNRLLAWLERGAIARSGVATFYDEVNLEVADDAVATTLFNTWIRSIHHQIWDDEGFTHLFAEDPVNRMVNVLVRLINGIGPDNPEALTSFDPDLGASVFFDDVTTTLRETADESLLLALVDAHTRNSSDARFGTEAISEWRWGNLHQVRLESILVTYASSGLGAFEPLLRSFSISPRTLPLVPGAETNLPWFPRGGDLQNVNAASWRIERDDFQNAYGSVYRLIVRLPSEGDVTGSAVLPGGQSGRTASPHFADQAALWFGGQDLPLLLPLRQVVGGAVARETYLP